MKATDQQPNERKAGAVLSYAVIAVQFVVALIYTPIMLRLLGQTEYGLYNLVGSIISYLGLLSFGFSGAYIRFYARFRAKDDNDGIRRLNGIFLGFFTTMGLLAAVGGAILTLNVQHVLGGQFSASELATAEILFAILTLNLAITFPTMAFDAHIVARERFVFQKTLLVAKAITTPVVVLPTLMLGYQSVGMAAATTVVNLVFTVATINFALSKLRMRFAFRPFDKHLLGEVARFSSFLFINVIVDQINWNVGKLIVGRFYGAVPVAVYSVGAVLNAYYLMFSTAISSVFVPRVNQMVANDRPDGEVSELFIRVGRLQFLVLGLVLSGFVFFGRPFIALWAGPTYGGAYAVALLLMAPVTIPIIQNLGIEIQKAKNLHHFRSWSLLAVAAANVLLSIPLTQRFGIVGAASATAVTLLVGNGILMNWYYHARVGLDIKKFWGQILTVARGMIPALIVGTAMLLIGAESLRPLWIAAMAILYIASYLGGAWMFGMNDYERSTVRGVARRLVPGRRPSRENQL